MTLSPDRERVRQILSETIGLLCRNGLSFDFELSVDALIGITVDHKDVFLISIKDTFDSERNLQQPYSSNSTAAVQLLNDCSKDDSVLKCDLPSSVTNDWRSAEKNLISEKQIASNNLFPVQSCCKRLLERNKHPDDQTKRARISVGTNVEASQVQPTLLTVVKSEPCDSLLATTCTSGRTFCVESPNSSASRVLCSSGSVSFVNCQLSSVVDSVRLAVGASSYNEDISGKVPDVSCSSKESNSNDLPSICIRRNESIGVSSRFSSDCNDGVSISDKQDISQVVSDLCHETSSNSQKQSFLPPSGVHTQNSSSLSQCNFQIASICHAGQSSLKKRSNSEGSSDSLILKIASGQTISQRTIQQRKSYDLHAECASSDSEVICIKEEMPYVPFNSSASSLIDPPTSVQNSSARLKEILPTQRSVDSLNLDSLSDDHSVGWTSIRNSFCQVRRQQKDAWGAWHQDNVMSSSFMDAHTVEKQLKQAAQSILLYDGQYVPLRDIQRLRLCGMAAVQIKLAMEQLSSYDGKLGCFQMLHGGVNLFYKCPPNLVDRETLESSYCIPWETYKFHYDVTPASNITTRHNEQYWLKVASSSPYISANQDVLVA